MREVRCKPKYLKALALLLALFAGTPVGAAEAPRVPYTQDLLADARQATQASLPILLTFATRNCGYCELLEAEFLRPMLISGLYEDKTLIRKILIDEGKSVIDFNGEKIYAERLAARYRVHVVPTVVFIDASGKELAERLVGINTPEMYGGYLDANIDSALAQVRRASTSPQATALLRFSAAPAPNSSAAD